MHIPEQSTMMLTHYGRRSGKPFTVKIWYTVIDGELWIGSLDTNRNWVKNLAANGKAMVDFGKGAVATSFVPVEDSDGLLRYRKAITAKHPIMSRILALVVRGGRYATFRAKTNA